jgi:signal transduction histidine kinase
MTASAEQKFRVLSQVVVAANAALPLERRLEGSVRALADGLGVDLCAVLLIGAEGGGLSLAALSERAGGGGQLRAALEALVSKGWDANEIGAAGEEPVQHKVAEGKLLADRFFAAATGGGPMAGGLPDSGGGVASWPLRDENFLYGLLCLGAEEGAPHPPADLLEAVTRELASVVRASRHYEIAKRQVSDLNVLLEVGRWISSTMELEELLKMVVAITRRIAHAKASAVGLAERRSGELRVVAMDELGRARVFRRTEAGEWEDLRRELVERLEAAGPAPTLCVPLSFKSPNEGCLCLYGVERPGGRPSDELLAAVAGIISSALENAVIFRQVGDLAERNQRMVRLLSTFYELSQALMTTVRFEDRQRIILRALTLPQGLRFGRAMLMLVDEESRRLRLSGALTAIPDEQVTREAGLAESLTCNGCLPEGQEFAEARGFEVDLEGDDAVFAATVRHGRAHLISDPRSDGRVLAPFAERLGGLPFATVPIKAKGKVIGLLYIDNGPGGQAIEERDMRALGMLANLAGLAIDDAMLYEYVENTNNELKLARERMIETEKLAALGELAAGMAHEIRNPLVSIGGFTRRVDRTLEEDSPLKPYLSVIITEVEKLERTLGEILTFSGEGQDHFAAHNLNRIAEEALGLLKREFEETEIEIVRDYGQLPPVFCDGRQVKHVFFNLLLNAKQAMGQTGLLTIRTGCEGAEGPRVWCEISDTGSGIAPGLLHNIFNPFFTTKDTGSGLGLSIAHKIMTRHRGEITVANKPGAGAAFTVKLPLGQA